MYQSGEKVDFIAAIYGLKKQEVKDAIQFYQKIIKRWDEIKKLSSSKVKRQFAYRYTIRSGKAEPMK